MKAALVLAALALTACTEKRIVTSLKPPSERLQCVPAGERPTIPPEYRVDWTKALAAPNVKEAVALAMQEHMAFVATVRSREGVVAGYVLKVEGQLFVCSTNATWLRDWYAAQD